MTRISNRLKAIVKFVDIKDKVVDVGCDLGFLSIYLYENKLVSKVIASDINKNALSSAINNIKKRNLDIETVLSDGINNVDMKGINTLVISGMGTGTILHILEDDSKLKKVNKLIIQSNNDHEILRRKMNEKGYYLENEEYTYDKGKWYVTCRFVKSDNKNIESQIKYGFLSNSEYNDYLILQENKIVKRIPWSSFKAKFKAKSKLKELKKAISDMK